jgi:hypothetical protein
MDRYSSQPVVALLEKANASFGYIIKKGVPRALRFVTCLRKWDSSFIELHMNLQRKFNHASSKSEKPAPGLPLILRGIGDAGKLLNVKK